MVNSIYKLIKYARGFALGMCVEYLIRVDCSIFPLIVTIAFGIGILFDILGDSVYSAEGEYTQCPNCGSHETIKTAWGSEYKHEYKQTIKTSEYRTCTKCESDILVLIKTIR